MEDVVVDGGGVGNSREQRSQTMRAMLSNELTDASKTQEAGRHVSIL